METSVLIVGAGPTGLTMALALARYGIKARIIDQKANPTVTSNALGIQSRTLDVFQDLGIVDKALNQGHIVKGASLFDHKKRLINLRLNELNTEYSFILGLPQSQTETILIECLKHEYGIEVEWNSRCVGLSDQNTDVTLETNNQQKTDPFSWVIACDGSRSTIRELTQTPFVGHRLKQTFMMVDCVVNWALPDDIAHGFLHPDGIMAVIPMKTQSRIIVDITKHAKLLQKTDLTLADFQTIADQRSHVSIHLSDDTWITRFHVSEKQVTTYRKNRIFFAGDAAHIHSPVGGQGLNTGVQDAYNLAWKLAFVIQGKATENLLDTYHLERYPIAQAVLNSTTKATGLITTSSFYIRLLRNTAFFCLSKLPRIRQSMLAKISQINVHYDQGCLDKSNQSGFSKQSPGVGYRAINQKSLHQRIDGVEFKLLIFLGEQKPEQCADFIESIKRNYGKQISVFFISKQTDPNVDIIDNDHLLHQYFSCENGGFYVLRPDNVIALRSHQFNSAQVIGLLKRYLTVNER